MDAMPKVDDAKAFAVLLLGAAVGGIIFKLLETFGLLAHVRSTIGGLTGRLKAA